MRSGRQQPSVRPVQDAYLSLTIRFPSRTEFRLSETLPEVGQRLKQGSGLFEVLSVEPGEGRHFVVAVGAADEAADSPLTAA